MKHPGLKKKLNDMEFERRSSQVTLQQMLLLVPLLVLGGQIYLFFGSLPLPIVSATVVSYALMVFIGDWLARRSNLQAMRREGLIDDSYEPPRF
jgi:hypothetical protein